MVTDRPLYRTRLGATKPSSQTTKPVRDTFAFSALCHVDDPPNQDDTILVKINVVISAGFLNMVFLLFAVASLASTKLP